MSTYLIVDLNNLAHRCLHGTQGDIDTKAGMALHITLNALRASWRKFKADHIVFCLEGRSWRKDFYTGYKAHRIVQQSTMTKKEREDNELFFGTFDVFMNFIREKTNCTVLKCDVAEADDMIARWTQLHPDDQHIIVSSDRDFFQLLSENVRMYDGVRGWTIGIDGYTDDDGKPVVVKRNQKILDKTTGKKITKPVEIKMEAPDPEYALFTKIIRGDSSDNIMSAYPGVRENGSSKKPGIKEAYDDRHSKGFNWNNFMLQEWNKLVGADDEGNAITERVRVIDEFKFNQKLVDLTQQPKEVITAIDTAIADSVVKKQVPMVGIHFLRFTEEMGLFTIGKNPNEYAQMLASGYVS